MPSSKKKPKNKDFNCGRGVTLGRSSIFMISKPLDLIQPEDIQSLVEQQVMEGRTLEFKLTLPSSTDDAKREFLKDVSALSNTGGGDLVYGLSEAKGAAITAPGVEVKDPDQEILRLESLIRDGLEPRLSGVRIRILPGFGKDRYAVIVRISKSWSGPHVVSYKNLSRFFARTSAGVYQMDISEIRAAFAASESIPERVRKYIKERINLIEIGETPLKLENKPKLVIHLIPIGSLLQGLTIDIRKIKTHDQHFRPPLGIGHSSRFNLDGLLLYSRPEKDVYSEYCLVSRTGIIEAVDACMIGGNEDKKLIPSTAFEEDTIKNVASYLQGLKQLEVPLPISIMVTLVGVKGYEMAVDIRFSRHHSTPIDRSTAVLPEVIAETYDVDVADLLRPVFDAAWNAAGFPGSLNYDDSGKWRDHSSRGRA